MEYPYINQTARKAALKEGDFIMFAAAADAAKGHAVDSGVIIKRNEHNILVSHEDNNGKKEPVWYELNDIILYRDSEWPDPDFVQVLTTHTEFTATNNLGERYRYRVIGIDASRDYDINLLNLDTMTTTIVEPEWFRQRAITVIEDTSDDTYAQALFEAMHAVNEVFSAAFTLNMENKSTDLSRLCTDRLVGVRQTLSAIHGRLCWSRSEVDEK